MMNLFVLRCLSIEKHKKASCDRKAPIFKRLQNRTVGYALVEIKKLHPKSLKKAQRIKKSKDSVFFYQKPLSFSKKIVYNEYI